MGIGYNSLIGALLTFLNDSWDSVKVVKSIENTVFRTFCCGELEIIGCYIKLNGETFRIEYNIMDCETYIVLNSGVNVYLNDEIHKRCDEITIYCDNKLYYFWNVLKIRIKLLIF